MLYQIIGCHPRHRRILKRLIVVYEQTGRIREVYEARDDWVQVVQGLDARGVQPLLALRVPAWEYALVKAACLAHVMDVHP